MQAHLDGEKKARQKLHRDKTEDRQPAGERRRWRRPRNDAGMYAIPAIGAMERLHRLRRIDKPIAPSPQ
ncbi:MAG: hypothetical protein ACRED5_16540 [Propylenella sp.]